MYINEDVLKYFLNDGFEGLEKNKEVVKVRFEKVKKVFSMAKQINEDELLNSQVIKNMGIEEWSYELGRKKFEHYKRFVGIEKQNEYFCDYFRNLFPKNKYKNGENFVMDLLCIIGGFDLKTKTLEPRFRLMSNYFPNKDYFDFNGDLNSVGLVAKIISSLTNNNLFFEFCRLIQNINADYKNYLVLEWDSKSDEDGANLYEVFKPQQDKLNYSFLYKFIWMWANANKVIHPISLDAFRNFLKSDFMQEIFKELSAVNDFNNLKYIWYHGEKYDFGKQTELKDYPWVITDCHFDSFPAIWKKVSEKVSEKLKCDDFEKLSKVISFLCIGETDMKNISDLLETHKQIILYGVPGTGKTYSAKKVVYDWIKKLKNSNNNEENADNNEDKEDINKIIEPYRIKNFKKSENNEINSDKNIIWDIVQFHPNYSYQDFIGGIAPKVDNGGSLSYTLNHGIFKKFCDCAKENRDKKFIFIIDEINRANLSEVFGELLYALEYRDESVSVANFDEFCIPSNVYIIGTMNNVDKSLATFDLALRRRFGFYEAGVDYGVIADIIPNTTEENNSQEANNDKSIKTNINGYIKRCKELNYLLTNDEKLKQEISVDRLPQVLENTQDYYKIGHAYFMKIKNFMDKDEFVINPQHLEKLWIYHIEPLLMEYLGLSYDDSDVKKSIDEIKQHFVKKLDEE